jgi:hypothetical protein
MRKGDVSIDVSMSTGEFLTKATIWMALIAYAIGASMLLLARGRERWLCRARVVWTIGCVFFVAHVVCAFAYFHGWSHAAAYDETARQTAEMTGVHSGAGLYLNYLFGVVWGIDVIVWWVNPSRVVRRPRWLTGLWQGFFFFMVFNGAVLFGKGAVRWLGAGICGVLAWAIWRRQTTTR